MYKIDISCDSPREIQIKQRAIAIAITCSFPLLCYFQRYIINIYIYHFSFYSSSMPFFVLYLSFFFYLLPNCFSKMY